MSATVTKRCVCGETRLSEFTQSARWRCKACKRRQEREKRQALRAAIRALQAFLNSDTVFREVHR